MGGLTETPSRGRVLAILGFHKIGGPPAGGWDTWFYVSEATFSSFLSQLQEGAWHVIDLQTFLVGLAAPASLPTRSALLTFDDGYRSEEHTSELQSQSNLVCRLLLEKKKRNTPSASRWRV